MAGRTPKIPPHLEAIVRERVRAYGQRPTAAWLKDEHGIAISHVAVGNLTRAKGPSPSGRVRTATPAAPAPADSLGDVATLSRHIATLDAQALALCAQLGDASGPLADILRAQYRATVEQLRKLTETKGKLTPAEPDAKKPPKIDTGAAIAAVREMLSKPAAVAVH